jgi:hypothetical protein
MRPPPRLATSAVLFACVAGFSAPVLPGAGACRADEAPAEVVLGECLVLPPVGRYGRSPLHVDGLEAAVVAGHWKAPRKGDVVRHPDGRDRAWEAATAKSGELEHTALRGGYVFWEVRADAPRVALLEASGHTMAYVNGEPRAGDLYQTGYVRLPVRLRAGANELLFHVGRDRLKARLVAPPAEVMLDTRDATVPDYRPGEEEPPWAGAVLVNAGLRPLEGLTLRARRSGGEGVQTPAPLVPPLSTRKVGVRLPHAPSDGAEKVAVEVELLGKPAGSTPMASARLDVRVRRPGQSYKRTFVSDIDGSVQYYAVQPARPAAPGAPAPALVLTLHGAAVEALGEADAYAPKDWCHLVAPTNRRPFGFDWEEWGRLDALEVLERARAELHTDPLRTYLTGHSMGGHGTWHVGATFPDRFAAIAPSAGWVSFASYAGGAPQPDRPSPLEALLLAPTAPSRTLDLAGNYARLGVYVLHGDADDNVPVGQARIMREALGRFHPDFAYHEQPGAGHWWGNACVDWPPLFDFLSRRTLPRRDDVRRVDFTTASPGVSARCDWAGIEQQERPGRFSTVRLRWDPERRLFKGTTENVGLLALNLGHAKPGSAVRAELDGQGEVEIPWPAGSPRAWLGRAGGRWAAVPQPSPAMKGPHRYGPFKEAFRNRVLFVYGTRGTDAENAWAFAKARFDAETFWYRGNGSVDVVADADFDPAREPDRNVVLYGHAECNGAWKSLLDDSPVQVRRGAVAVGGREEKDDDLACLFVRPRPGSDRALVAAVAGSGLPGLRLTDRLPYFVSGCGYPDWTVLSTAVLTTPGTGGVRGAGYFANDWSVSPADSAWGGAPHPGR